MEKNKRIITKECKFHTVFETSSKSCVKFFQCRQGSLFSSAIIIIYKFYVQKHTSNLPSLIINVKQFLHSGQTNK